jgi:hypothetical protein
LQIIILLLTLAGIGGAAWAYTKHGTTAAFGPPGLVAILLLGIYFAGFMP